MTDALDEAVGPDDGARRRIGSRILLFVQERALDCESLPAKWPTVFEVVRSMFGDVDVPWERWF